MPNDEYDSPSLPEESNKEIEKQTTMENETAVPVPLNEEEKADEEEPKKDSDQKKSISADLIRGHINTIILRSLFEGDRYGYDIINEIEQKSHGQYQLKQPTLYSALKRLESQGYVKSYWGGVSNGGRRRYFSLTEEGKEVVRQNQAEWEYSRTIIDNLISEKDFDFSNPAPQKLDFRILRQSTSRTPIVTEEMLNNPQFAGELTIVSGNPIDLQPTQSMSSPEENFPSDTVSAATLQNDPTTPTTIQDSAPPEKTKQNGDPTSFSNNNEVADSNSSQLVSEQAQTSSNESTQAQQTISTAEQQISFQSQQTTASPRQENRYDHPPLPLFGTLSEQERNYKDIIASIYRKAIKAQKKVAPQPINEQPPLVHPEAESIARNEIYVPAQQTPHEEVSVSPQTIPSESLNKADLPSQQKTEFTETEPISPPQNQPSQQTSSLENTQTNTSRQKEDYNLPPRTDFIQESSVSIHSAPDEILQPETAPHEAYKEEKKSATGKIDFYDIAEQARYDGLRVWTSESSKEKKNLPEKFFNKGLVLLQSALVFFFVALLESVLTIIFKDKLIGSEIKRTIYVIGILAYTFSVPLICSILYFSKYQPCCKRFNNTTIIYDSIILFVILFILVVVIALFAKVSLTDERRVLAYLAIPTAFLLDIFVFSLSYFFLSKEKRE